MLYRFVSNADIYLEWEAEMIAEQHRIEADEYQEHLAACRQQRQDEADAFYDDRSSIYNSTLNGDYEERQFNQDIPYACHSAISC